MNEVYTSTRNKMVARSPKETILKGIAEDGGLFVYDGLTDLKLPLQDMMKMSYQEMTSVILSMLLPDFSCEEVEKCVHDAYDNQFTSEDITPLHSVGNTHILELFHGPTCAFKDVGLRMLPQLMSTSLKKYNDEKVMILTATSGDTGKAALEGFKDVDNIGITVFYPDQGVSNIQRLQMITQEGKNTSVCAIKGNFDDAQSNVKKIFGDAQIAQRLKANNIVLSSANSINIGRLIPQIVYYIYAYKEMVKQGHIVFGDEINFCVPTGNYGNVLAGYYAKCMGLPVHKFIVASNANNVLYDFLKDGKYDRKRPFYKTISPSMDILISSNLERLLYYKSGKDDAYIASLMKQLEKDGFYQVRDEVFESVKEDFCGGYCDDEACAKAIKSFYEETQYVMDPHTAIAYKVLQDYEVQDTTHQSVVLSTASPYKFAPAVYEAIFGKSEVDEFTCMAELQKKTGAQIPSPLQALQTKEIRHTSVIENNEMSNYVEKVAKEMLHG
ncbi:MAG: threonine synthase [Longicatena sp.]